MVAELTKLIFIGNWIFLLKQNRARNYSAFKELVLGAIILSSKFILVKKLLFWNLLQKLVGNCSELSPY